MAPKNRTTKKLGTSQFLERLATVIDTPEIKTFQWSSDGKSVVVNSRFYEDEISCYEELSILKRFRSVAALRGFLCTHGFKRIARGSSCGIHVFQHPDFSIKGVVNTKGRHKRTKGVGSLDFGTQKRGLLQKSEREALDNVSSNSPSDLFFPPVKKRNARHLYQYINYTLPVHQSQLPQGTLPGTFSEGAICPAQPYVEQKLPGSTSMP